MIPGFERIIEERIQHALRKGDFDNLPGYGRPLALDDNLHIPEDMRLAYKILKNADCIPPEIELKKEIHRMEDALAAMPDTAEKYHQLKKLNFLIMKLNTMRNTSINSEVPQKYLSSIAERFSRNKSTV